MSDQDVLKMQQRKDFLIKFCYWAVIVVCVYAVFKYLLPVLFPFVLAYGIAYILVKPVRRVAGESRWKRAFFSTLLSAVFFMTVGGLAVWMGVWLFSSSPSLKYLCKYYHMYLSSGSMSASARSSAVMSSVL